MFYSQKFDNVAIDALQEVIKGFLSNGVE